MRSVLLWLLLAAPLAVAADVAAIPAFSAARPGDALAPAWRELVPPNAAAPRFDLIDDAGVTVLRVRADAAAGALAHAARADLAASPVLSWRWKVERVVERADLGTRQGDDFAARLYVFFDVPVSALPLGARLKLLLARLLYGEALPSAAICYVWDNRHPIGTSRWSPYTDRVRTVVLESGLGRAGRWTEERRDLAADYRAAFGQSARPYPVSGVAVGSDTDQTGESVTAWFGDVVLARGSGP